VRTARSILDQLISDAKLYTTTAAYRELLDFVCRLRNFAPFNAMLLQIQKPGLRYAASASDWGSRFGRWPKEGARPLLIMWPFGPVALVYDVADTVGAELPQDVEAFYARGPISKTKIIDFDALLRKKKIEIIHVDAGDSKAGSIRIIQRPPEPKKPTLYRMTLNQNHPPATQFVTIAHELAHLFLGHLGVDKYLSVPARPPLSHAQQEVEAESVAYLLAKRNGIEAKSETYLKDFLEVADQLDIYSVMRAAGQIEHILELSEHSQFVKR
jgi:hypothetical protein